MFGREFPTTYFLGISPDIFNKYQKWNFRYSGMFGHIFWGYSLKKKSA